MRLPLWALFCLLLMVARAHGEEDDLRSLELYNGEGVELVTTDRAPRPASQTAENITVVTAREIEALNAHTLADVLFTVTGVQIETGRTPGAFVYLQIQGSKYNHILVLVDDVPLNILAENIADISAIPVQMIERIEIVKGAASSSWGSALGGVVNVITKSPHGSSSFDGLASLSYGTRKTVDGRVEASGAVGRFGYYLNGGKLRSDGLLVNNEVSLSSFYGKAAYDLPARGSFTLTAGLSHNDSGLYQTDYQRPGPLGNLVTQTAMSDQAFTQFFSTLQLLYPVTDRFNVEGTLRTRQSRMSIDQRDTSFPGLVLHQRTEESAYGASVIASWRSHLQRVVAGIDYDHLEVELNQAVLADQLTPTADRVGIYLNDTFTIGDFAVIPSARFDYTDSGGNLFSPSLGVTYAVTDNTVVRGYTARGYSLTSLNRSDSTEKVWTSQVGFESSDVPYLWIKGTLFRNDTWDVAVPVPAPGTPSGFVLDKQSILKQGYELELRTTPFYGASLSLGYNYINARNEDTDTAAEGVARHTLNVGVQYEEPHLLRALLIGHYVDWNGSGDRYDGKYTAMIWDLHLARSFQLPGQVVLDLFASVHNLFNGAQYLFPMENPRRWGEVGVRCAF